MAFLKSSRITGITARDVAVRGFRQSNNINLGTRAYTRHEVLLADTYSIKGDVNISDNLILAKLSDDGEAITVTGDASATRTISGSGSLEGSTFAQTPNASMTGMTGVVGSAVTNNAGVASGVISSTVTGSPNLNLGNATFPSGHILQMKRGQYTTQTSISTTPTKVIEVSLTAKAANSTWYGAWNFTCGQALDAQGWNLYASISTGTPDYTSSGQIWNSCASPNYPTMIEGNDLGNISTAHETSYSFGSTSGDLSTTASGSTGGSFAEGAVVLCAFWVRGNTTVYVNRSANRGSEHETGITSLTVWEIAT